MDNCTGENCSTHPISQIKSGKSQGGKYSRHAYEGMPFINLGDCKKEIMPGI